MTRAIPFLFETSMYEDATVEDSFTSDTFIDPNYFILFGQFLTEQMHSSESLSHSTCLSFVAKFSVKKAILLLQKEREADR